MIIALIIIAVSIGLIIASVVMAPLLFIVHATLDTLIPDWLGFLIAVLFVLALATVITSKVMS